MDYFVSLKNCRIKSIILFLSLSFYLCSSPLYAQNEKVSITVTNEPVKTVFDLIAKQVDVNFFYDSKRLNKMPNVTINATEQLLETVLETVSKQTGLLFNRNKNTINVGFSEQSKSGSKIKGIVVDQNGDPIIGANVKVKDAALGVITDINGAYELTDVPNGATIVFSYIGYQTVTLKSNSKELQRVILHEDTELLDEVVVIGYGTMKKKDLMGAATMVNGDDLATNSNISVGGALQGKMSGINILSSSGFPGTETSINIRGVGTFGSGDSSPLVVIDGIPVDQGFETLNPSDIESVNVLKDASSAAIYGSRAANGVILVTTKKGKQGKATVSVNATWGMQSPSHMMDLLTAEEFVSAIFEMRDNKKAIDGGNPTTKYDGLNPASFGKGTNWGDYIYDSAPTFNVNANISGGTDKMHYYLSGEYLDQDGIAINTGYKKAGLRSNIEAEVSKRLKVGNNINMTYRYTEGSSGNRYSDVIFNAPITPAYDEDGSYGEPDTKLTGSKNAMAEVGWNTPTNSNYRLMDNLFLEFKITDWLKFRFNGGIDMVYNEYKSFSPKYNDGGQTNNQNSYSETRSKNLMWMTDYLLYFDKTFGKHTINAMGGFSQQLFTKDDLHGKTKDFISETDNMHVINGGTNTLERELSGGKSELALASYFGRINYDYAGRYLFSFNLRADGSSRFNKDCRWGVFPSFSGAWRISEESFFDVKTISNLKLRASWGQLGNQSIGSWYPTVASVSKQNVIFGTSADDQYLYAGYSQTKLGNKALEWETTTVTNIGIDLGLFNNSLYISADYFVKSTDGILRSMVLPPSVGLGAPNMNYAKVQNSGFDFEIGYKGKIHDFNYSVSANASFLHNEIKKLSSGVDEEIINIGCYGGVTINRVGEAINSLYGYKTDGLITTAEEAKKYKEMGQGNAKIGRLKYADLNGDGKITGDDRTILGNCIPKVSAGLTLSADWKGFDFNTVFSGVFGRKQHSPMSFQNRMPNRNMSRHWYDNRWTLGSDPTGKYPALIQSESYEEMTDLMVTNSSFVKMKSLTLGYTFNLKPNRVRIFVSGENLLTIHHKNFDGFDPENGNSVGHYTNWGDDFPTPRIFLIGTNLTF